MGDRPSNCDAVRGPQLHVRMQCWDSLEQRGEGVMKRRCQEACWSRLQPSTIARSSLHTSGPSGNPRALRDPSIRCATPCSATPCSAERPAALRRDVVHRHRHDPDSSWTSLFGAEPLWLAKWTERVEFSAVPPLRACSVARRARLEYGTLGRPRGRGRDR